MARWAQQESVRPREKWKKQRKSFAVFRCHIHSGKAWCTFFAWNVYVMLKTCLWIKLCKIMVMKEFCIAILFTMKLLGSVIKIVCVRVHFILNVTSLNRLYSIYLSVACDTNSFHCWKMTLWSEHFLDFNTANFATIFCQFHRNSVKQFYY